MTKSMKIPTNNLALALGGGAARGAFHLGVLDFCEQHNIVIQAYSGSSIGAIVSASHASGVTAREQLKIFSSKEMRQTLKFNYFRNGLLRIDASNKIIKELTERGDVKHARISADGRYLYVDTIDGEFSVVMYSAVNICSRIANCELSFVKFDYTA